MNVCNNVPSTRKFPYFLILSNFLNHSLFFFNIWSQPVSPGLFFTLYWRNKKSQKFWCEHAPSLRGDELHCPWRNNPNVLQFPVKFHSQLHSTKIYVIRLCRRIKLKSTGLQIKLGHPVEEIVPQQTIGVLDSSLAGPRQTVQPMPTWKTMTMMT